MNGNKAGNFALFVLPLLCQLTAIFNAVFVRFGLHRLYLAVYALSLLVLLFSRNYKRHHSIMPAIIYLFLLTGITILHLVAGEEPLLTFSGFLTYFLPVLYWVIYSTKAYNDNILRIFRVLRIPYAILAVLAVVQYFFAPNLYGFYIADEGMMKWAADSDFASYSAYFRASSLFGSPQNLGLSMALYIVVYLHFFIRRGNLFDYTLIALYVVAGILSGSKSFFFLVGLYIITVVFLFNSKASTKILLGIAVASIIMLLNYFSGTLGFLDRISDADRIMEGEQRGRLAIFTYVLSNITLVGEGPGVAQAISGFTRNMNALESYLFQMLYETGILTSLAFIAFLISGFIKSHHKIIFAIIAFSMVYVHCFNSFMYFIFWAFILLPYIVPHNDLFTNEGLRRKNAL